MESERGYLSLESKRRFTFVAGALGALFFLGQFILPMVVMFLVMVPSTFMRDMKNLELDGAAVMSGDLWAVEQTVRLSMRSPGNPTTTLALTRVRLADLSEDGPSISLEGFETDTAPELIVAGERLWMIGSSAMAYYERGALKYLPETNRPKRASRPFVYQGRPAVITLGTPSALAVLQDDADTGWVSREIALGRPAGVGSLKSVQAVEAGGSLYLLGQLCSDESEPCSLSYRELAHLEWLPLVDDVRSSANWTAVSIASRPAVFVSDTEKDGATHLSLVTVGANGPQRTSIPAIAGTRMVSRWRPLSSGSRFILVSSDGMPGALRLAEIEDGRVTRTSRRPGSFPFGPNMMVFMVIPQLLPIVLSLILALVLTVQMRRHRVPDYELGAERRAFASLWQRALAQLVDLIPFVAGFALPTVWIWRAFSDPETFFENGATFPWTMIALFIGSFVWALVVLLTYSYFEGRFGKTPGKWLVGIRVLGTDLQPCGFGRAFLRNLLTFVDGFFSFLVGALLVALTENWQRVGDMAARTIVVVDPQTS